MAEGKVEIEHGLSAVSFVLSAISTCIVLNVFIKSGYKSPNYDNVLSKGVLKLSLGLSVVALICALAVFLVKDASPYIKLSSVYLAVLSLVSCIVLGMMVGRKPISKGVQVSITLLNIPMIIAIVVAFFIAVKSGGL